MSILDQIAGSASALMQAPDGVVYRIRRVRSIDLSEHKHAELVGAVSADSALKEVRARLKAESDAWKLDQIKDPAEREIAEHKRKAWAARAEEAEAEALARHLAGNANILTASYRQTDAYCMAGITGAAQPVHDRDPNYPPSAIAQIEEREIEIIDAAASGDDDRIAEAADLRERLEAARALLTYTGRVREDEVEGLTDLRFVEDEEDEDVKSGRLWIGRLDDVTRAWLAGVIGRFSGSPSVATFR